MNVKKIVFPIPNPKCEIANEELTNPYYVENIDEDVAEILNQEILDYHPNQPYNKSICGAISGQNLINKLKEMDGIVSGIKWYKDDSQKESGKLKCPNIETSDALCLNLDAEKLSHEWLDNNIGDKANNTENTNNEDYLVVSWYTDPRESENSISYLYFVKISNNENIHYRCVALVKHDKDNPERLFGPYSSHAGGITLQGYYIYVAKTNKRFDVFDVRDIMKVKNVIESSDTGFDGSNIYTHNNRYILPRKFQYSNLKWKILIRDGKYSNSGLYDCCCAKPKKARLFVFEN
jgi:hypothetical protein